MIMRGPLRKGIGGRKNIEPVGKGGGEEGYKDSKPTNKGNFKSERGKTLRHLSYNLSRPLPQKAS